MYLICCIACGDFLSVVANSKLELDHGMVLEFPCQSFMPLPFIMQNGKHGGVLPDPSKSQRIKFAKIS